jgi:uncharacterized protein (TIGR03085 family)
MSAGPSSDGRPLDAQERAKLAELLVDLGPDAPTLCEGWSTADMAAHLVVRERDPRSGPGILLGGTGWGGRFEEYTNKLMARQKAKGYERTVERVRSGPPLVPWGLPGLRTALNLQEYFVHHEDVRRANGMAARPGMDELQDALWSALKRGARLQLRKVKDAGVELARPTGDAFVAKKGEPSGRIVGEPGELVLFLTGRRGAAQVSIEGDPAAITALERANLSL